MRYGVAMSHSSPVWYQILIAAASGVIVGQVAPSFVRLFTRPRLHIYLRDPGHTHYKRGVAGKTGVNGHWLGVWVEQRRLRLGRTPAADCIAELVSVEELGVDKPVVGVPAFESDLLSWAAMGERAFLKRDIYPGQPVRISLCWKESDAPHALAWDVQPTGLPSGRLVGVAPGAYRVRIRVYSSSAAWTEATFEIRHGAEFSELEITRAR